MLLLENILYGVISGLTEFLPVSARGHQTLLHYMFGNNTGSSLTDLLVHIGVLFSLFIACRDNIGKLYREQNAVSVGRKKVRHLDVKSYYDLRLLKSAAIPIIIGMLLLKVLNNKPAGLLSVMGFCVLNGVILLIVEHMRRGNRDAKTMSGFDGMMMGLATAAATIPGLSGTGLTISYSVAKGADTQNAANWAILLVIPAMIITVCCDVFLILGNGIGPVSVLTVLGSVLACIGAFCSGYVGISILRLMAANSSVFQFSYYSFGAALLTFVLYLLT